MPNVSVKIVDYSGKEFVVELPDDRPIRDVVAGLDREFKWPESDDQGHRLRTVLNHKGTGKDLSEDRTLTEEGVKANDVLRARRDPVAGKR